MLKTKAGLVLTFEVATFFGVAGSIAQIGFSPKPRQHAKVRRSQSLTHLVSSL